MIRIEEFIRRGKYNKNSLEYSLGCRLAQKKNADGVDDGNDDDQDEDKDDIEKGVTRSSKEKERDGELF